jgi:hypothetical protein
MNYSKYSLKLLKHKFISMLTGWHPLQKLSAPSFGKNPAGPRDPWIIIIIMRIISNSLQIHVFSESVTSDCRLSVAVCGSGNRSKALELQIFSTELSLRQIRKNRVEE